MDPFTALGAASGVVGIIGFGLQLATTLQTYVEGSLEADERIRAIANDISATSSALQQLEIIIEIDQKSKRKVFSSAGLKGVTDTANQCDAVFKKVVGLLNDATKAKNEDGEQSIDALRLGRMDRLKWPWLEPKISRCRQELERLLLKLLVMLQVVTLGRHQMMSSKQPAGGDLNGRQLREIIMALDRREKLATRKLAEKTMKEVTEVDPGHDLEDGPRVTPTTSEAFETLPVQESQTSKEIEPTKPEIVLQSKPGFDPVLSPDSTPHYPEFEKHVLEDAISQHSPSVPSFFSRGKSPRPRSASPIYYLNSPTELRAPIKVSGALETSLLPLEAFLIKRRKHILKIPLEQSELWKQMQTILARSNQSAWDTLLALSADDHTDVSELLKSTEKDGQERILAAIEVSEARSRLSRVFNRVLRRQSGLRRVMVFLRVVPEYMRYTRPLGPPSPPPPPPPPFVKVQNRFIDRRRERSPTPPRIEDMRAPLIGIAAGAAAACLPRQRESRSPITTAQRANAAHQPRVGFGIEDKFPHKNWSRVGSERDSQDSHSDVYSFDEAEGPKHREAYVIGRRYENSYVLEEIPRHHHPARLDDVLEDEDERSRPVSRGRSSASNAEETRELESDAVDDLLSKWTTVFADESGSDTMQAEKGVESEAVDSLDE